MLYPEEAHGLPEGRKDGVSQLWCKLAISGVERGKHYFTLKSGATIFNSMFVLTYLCMYVCIKTLVSLYGCILRWVWNLL